MLKFSSPRSTAALAFGAFALAVLPASAAPDPKAVADALVAAVGATDRAAVSYDGATASGETITIANYKVSQVDGDNVTIPSLVLEGVEARPEGGFTAESMIFDNGSGTRGKDKVAWATGRIEGALIPTPEEIRAKADLRPLSHLSMSNLTVTKSGLETPLTVAGVEVAVQPAADGTPGSFSSEVKGIHVSTEMLSDRPQEKAILDALGYQQLDINVASAGSFDAASKTMILDQMSINATDVGTLIVKGKFSGISAGEVATARNTPEMRSEAKIDNLEVRFENGGVVERALDMHAALTFGTREDAAKQVKAALPLFISLIGNDAFGAKLSKAVGDFLSDPQTITVSATPAAPVSMQDIFKTLRKPGALPDLLAVDVTAN